MQILFRQNSKLVPTAFKLLLIFGLAVVLPASVTVKPQKVLVNDGKPVQVWKPEHAPVQAHPPGMEDIRLKSGISAPAEEHAKPILQLPIRRGINNTDPGVFVISAFVDHDADLPIDYNCGFRTVNNHAGTDYRSPTFPKYTMANEGLIVIAAADGTILFRHDGESDTTCQPGNVSESNRIFLQHANGTFTYYANCKQGTVTPKQVGDTVEAGDYLCVVGSSGESTVPKLHMGVANSDLSDADPYAGECNSLNQDTWWLDQEPYEVKTINFVATHDAPPLFDVPCPEPEIPHFENQFMAGDSFWYSVSVRDIALGDVVEIEIKNPMGETVYQTSHSLPDDPDLPFLPEKMFLERLFIENEAPSGAYTIVATYNPVLELKSEGTSIPNNNGSTTEELSLLYVDSEPPPDPDAVPENNAYSGLYYDPLLDGEGYNIITHNNGTNVYFYGNDGEGNRLWLVSKTFYGPIINDQEMEFKMNESTGGVFAKPVLPDRGLAHWGNLTLVFTDCENGIATLVGKDGSKVSKIEKLSGIAGTNCPPVGERPDAALSGLHYDPGKDGEGYNLIVTPNGSLLYYYGFNEDGFRLWLASDLIREVLEINVDVVTPVYEVTRGTFNEPVHSDQSLVQWGTATITPNDCDLATIVLQGSDGIKTSSTIPLAGIIGLDCSS